MSYTISDMLIEGYHHNVSLIMQQRGSRLANCVRQEIQDTQRSFYDQIAPTEAQDVFGRHSDTVVSTSEIERRVVNLIQSDWADLIDSGDKLKFLTDPTSAFVLNAGYALGRKKDRRIIEALLGDAYCGPKGETKVSFLAENIIDVDYKESGATENTGLTVEKLRKARQLLDDANIDDDEEQYCIVTSSQIGNLLASEKVTSADYNTVKALVDGKINTFMGFTFKRVDSKLLPKTEDIREVICFAKSGLLLATNGDIKTQIAVRPDKRMAVQVYASMHCGATRMDERKVVKIECNE